LTRSNSDITLQHITANNDNQEWVLEQSNEGFYETHPIEPGIYYINNASVKKFLVYNPDITSYPAVISCTEQAAGNKMAWNISYIGNGKYTIPQIHLYEALGDGWVLEYAIPTKCKQEEHLYPTCYKVDLGYPTMKIAIEVDGRSHRWKGGLSKDLKKEGCLKNLGWTVLRFTNEEIMTNCSSAVLQIQNYLKEKSQCTI
jgi:hypothetical protein